MTDTEYMPKHPAPPVVTLRAGADIKAGTLLEISADNTVVTAAGVNPAIGVAACDCKNGDFIAVYRAGVHRLTAAAAITAGKPVKPAADGKITTADSNDPVFGVALTSASGADTVIEVWA